LTLPLYKYSYKCSSKYSKSSSTPFPICLPHLSRQFNLLQKLRGSQNRTSIVGNPLILLFIPFPFIAGPSSSLNVTPRLSTPPSYFIISPKCCSRYKQRRQFCFRASECDMKRRPCNLISAVSPQAQKLTPTAVVRSIVVTSVVTENEPAMHEPPWAYPRSHVATANEQIRTVPLNG
jgi:hypothetical protein